MNNEVKPIAMYLPQFHRVKENDEWWGEGFTEWTAVEKAVPLFEGHKQPKRPMNDYTYDLLQKETMEWQAQLMRKHGVYGMCFYHYWFENGRQILEKPAENLLKWTDIDMPFCFCWANESWVRTWSVMKGQNVWTSSYEPQSKEEGDGVLLRQCYGVQEDWETHFEYLVSFFQDKRYIKKDNKPVILFYKVSDIECIDEMIAYWNQLAIEKGFEGVYVIGANCGEEEIEFMDAELVTEPQTTIRREFISQFMHKEHLDISRYLSYDEVVNASLKYNKKTDKKTYYGGFVKYDDTARHGKNGAVIYNDTPEKFKVYLAELYAKNASLKNEFIFINAWNEWGEGMYLEPDQEYGEEYLQAFRYAEKHYQQEMYKYQDGIDKANRDGMRLQVERYKKELQIADQWLVANTIGTDITFTLRQSGYKKVAVYGMGILGKRLVDELLNNDFDVCCIDRRATRLNLKSPAFLPMDIPSDVDVVIVTLPHIFEQIEEDISQYYDGKILSLEQLFE